METCTCKACPVHVPRVNLNAAAACAPNMGAVWIGTIQAQVVPLHRFPLPNAAACAAPAMGWVGNY